MNSLLFQLRITKVDEYTYNMGKKSSPKIIHHKLLVLKLEEERHVRHEKI
jgi:hypothetical protein